MKRSIAVKLLIAIIPSLLIVLILQGWVLHKQISKPLKASSKLSEEAFSKLTSDVKTEMAKLNVNNSKVANDIINNTLSEQLNALNKGLENKIKIIAAFLVKVSPDAIISEEYTKLNDFAAIARNCDEIIAIQFFDNSDELLNKGYKPNGKEKKYEASIKIDEMPVGKLAIYYTTEILDKQQTTVENKGKELISSASKKSQNLSSVFLKEITGEIEKDKSELNSLQKDVYQKLTTMLFLGAILLLFASSVIVWLLLRKIVTNPISEAVNIAEAVKQGDLSKRLTVKSDDEIGRMATALNAMAEGLQDKSDTARIISEGDLTAKVKLASEKDTLGKSLDSMVNNLRETVTNVSVVSTQVNSGAAQIKGTSQHLSQGASTSAASLEEITSSMNEIGNQAKRNATNALEANNLAKASRNAAQNGTEKMQKMVSAMTEIQSSSREITNIIKTIDDIAFQTNLLALNAAVEAARAGRHGKGFAVVAEEVRSLAARSSKAAKDSAELIKSSNQKVKNGTNIGNQAYEALTEIFNSAAKVTDLIDKITNSSNEQAEGVLQVSKGLEQIDNITQQNAANAAETASSAQELSNQAQILQSMLAKFTLNQRHVTLTQYALDYTEDK